MRAKNNKTMAMAKCHGEDILNDSFKNKICDKIKIKVGINWDKMPSFHLDEYLDYYFSGFAQKIKYLKFISVK